MRRRHTQHRGKKRGRGESTANEWGERRDRKRRRRRRTNKRDRRSWGNRCCRSETLRPRNESRRRARAEMRREGGREGGGGSGSFITLIHLGCRLYRPQRGDPRVPTPFVIVDWNRILSYLTSNPIYSERSSCSCRVCSKGTIPIHVSSDRILPLRLSLL